MVFHRYSYRNKTSFPLTTHRSQDSIAGEAQKGDGGARPARKKSAQGWKESMYGREGAQMGKQKACVAMEEMCIIDWKVHIVGEGGAHK